MRKGLCFLICLLFIVVPIFSASAEDMKSSELLSELQATYVELSEQADAIMKEPIAVPVPTSTSISCQSETDTQILNDFQEAFNSPEGLLCTQMLDVQRQMQLLGAVTSYEIESALLGKLGQKALAMINDYGQDVDKVPAIAMVALRTATDIQLLGLDTDGYADALLSAISAMYENTMDELFRLLVEEHDYGTVRTILETARVSQLLSDTSGADTDEILNRLQKALRFELTINCYYEQTGNHRWVEQAVLEVAVDFTGSEVGKISGSGLGSVLSFIWDDAPDFSVVALDFPVQAVLENFQPCNAQVELLLTPFHPLSETLVMEGESIDWPMLKTFWEIAYSDKLQEDGLYRFPLTLQNLNNTAVSETIEYSAPENEGKMEILLIHTPQK